MQDAFVKYLNDTSQPTRQKALTAKSYKKTDPSLQDKDTNCGLATYGDALLKCAFCKILFNAGAENITEKKQQYESDKVLVEIIARHYALLDHIRFDDTDANIPRDYNYRKPSRKDKESKSKYIATAVEALIAAIYLDNGEDFGLVVAIAEGWKDLIDKQKTEP